MEARIARCLTAFDSAKEGLESPVHAPQRFPRHIHRKLRHILTKSTNLSQAADLVEQTDGFPFGAPSSAPFLKGSVVEFAADG